MLPKWVPPLLLLFVIFFVLSSPETAGPQARNFFGWIGEQASSAGQFLDGLFGDDEQPATTSSPNGSDTTDPSTTDTTSGSAPTDSFETLGPVIVEAPSTS